jgi:Dyp-type peroxidase family
MAASLTPEALNDIQAVLLRGTRMGYARYFALAVVSPQAARHVLGMLAPLSLGQTDADTGLYIDSAADRDNRPDWRLNLGITYDGLAALGMPAESLASFPDDFRPLTPKRAKGIGDVEESTPNRWLPAFACNHLSPPAVHVILVLFARSPEEREATTERVRQLIYAQGAFVELSYHDGQALPEEKVHFGYVDGVTQPQIHGGPPVRFRSPQPEVAAGEFVLGYENENGFAYPVPQPEALGRNGTYGVFRILKQDVDAFESFLTVNAPLAKAPADVDAREWLAAKLCGRWRNGVPLSLSPETDTPSPPFNRTQLDDFDFVPTALKQEAFDDRRGFRCPIGSHIRRSNPRSSTVAGGSPNSHRLIRRGIPYGPPYDSTHPNDGIERGLLGMFLCASIKNQFEFLMSEWINGDSFGLRGDLDPVTGRNLPASSRFVLPHADTPKPQTRLTGFGTFVTTRASAYCFLPSLTALRYIAGLGID